MRRFACLVAVLCCTSLAAEEIRLKNGDVIYGKVLSLDARSLELESENLGKVSIERDRVVSIRFAEPAGNGAWRVPMSASAPALAPHATLVPFYSAPFPTQPPTELIRPVAPGRALVPHESRPTIPASRPASRDEARMPPNEADDAREKIERLKSRCQEIERQLNERKDLGAEERERLIQEDSKLISEIYQLISEADEAMEQRMVEIIKQQLGITDKRDRARVTIAGPREVFVGSTADITVEVTNTSKTPLRNLRIGVDHPESVLATTATQGFELAQGGVVWKEDDLPAGESIRRRINFKAVKEGMAKIDVIVTGDKAAEAKHSMTTHIIAPGAQP